MLNKRGFTLIELIISLALMSIVSILMFNLLFKLSDIQSNSGFALNNQTNRLEIIKMVENDLINHKPISVSKEGNSFIFVFEDQKTSSLHIYNENGKDYVEYIPYDGSNYSRKWLMKNCQINYNNITICERDNIALIDIEINTDEEFNHGEFNNAIDDLNITYEFSSQLINIDECEK